MRGIVAAGLLCALVACATTSEPAPTTTGQQQSFDALVGNLREHQARQTFGGLTYDDITVVIKQIDECWKPPAGTDIRETATNLQLTMNPDGTVQSAQLLNPALVKDAVSRAAADSALQALRDPRCRQLKFPAAKYAAWENFTVTLDGSVFDQPTSR